MYLRSLYILSGFLMIAGFSSCFKDLPSKQIVLEAGFDSSRQHPFKVFNAAGRIDSAKTVEFNGSWVLGRFNNNLVVLKLDSIIPHNIVRIEFDLYIHGAWLGDRLDPVTGVPDVWQLKINQYPLCLTTFSNTSYSQSFPDNYQPNVFKYPAHSNAWGLLPGVCATASQPDGTAHYKMDLLTLHTSPQLEIEMNDALQPAGSQCLKSWSIDNVRITASTYK